MRKITLADRIRYQFDSLMSKGPIALIGWLFLVSAALILFFSTLVVITHSQPANDAGEPISFVQVAWMGLMRTLDAGTMGGDTGSWSFLLAMFAITLSGVFVVSMLIGILTSSLEAKIGDLRKGRSLVVERDHTLILGWSPQIFTIVRELANANANHRSGCIVVLAEKDKVEMEDEIRAKAGPTGRTRVVCRTGTPLEPTDLEISNPHDARAIIVLSSEYSNPDSFVIKTMLAIVNNPGRRNRPYHIVAEIRDPRNMEAACLVGREEATLIQSSEEISRIIVQTCRQTGLSVVYADLLDFGGDEIYFHEEPALVGRTFGDVLLAYETSAVIGLQTREGVRLNPPMGTVIARGDSIIAVSEDDDTVVLSGKTDPAIAGQRIRQGAVRETRPERTLILGWNRRGRIILRELDQYVAPGSEAMVVDESETLAEEIAQAAAETRHLAIRHREADPTNRAVLEGLDLPGFQHVITLANRETLSVQEADARTLVTLLHLRKIAEDAGHPFSITSEMLDLRNRQLAEITRADDFVVSETLTSLMLAQLAENRLLMPVFRDLFDPEGSELYLKPVEDYLAEGEEVNFYTIVEAARRRGETAIGYRLLSEADDSAKAHGIHLNPVKSEPVNFRPGDRIIVLAEN